MPAAPTTAASPSRRPRRRAAPFAAACAAAWLLAAGPGAADANLFAAGHGLHLVTDPRTGLALFGYDPVAYHAEHKARPGSPLHEATLDGRVWRFATAANKAAFEQDPQPYIPLFGGHDGSGVAGGVMVVGDPEVFALVAGRLALFRDEAARDRFAGDEPLRRQALADWGVVVRRHAGH